MGKGNVDRGEKAVKNIILAVLTIAILSPIVFVGACLPIGAQAWDLHGSGSEPLMYFAFAIGFYLSILFAVMAIKTFRTRYLKEIGVYKKRPRESMPYIRYALILATGVFLGFVLINISIYLTSLIFVLLVIYTILEIKLFSKRGRKR